MNFAQVHKDEDMKAYMKKYKFYLILAIIFGWGEVFFTTKSMYLMGNMLDLAIANNLQSEFLRISLVGILYVILCISCIFISHYFIQTFSISIVYDLQKKILKTMYRTQTSDYEKKTSEDYFTIIDHDVEQLRATYFNNIPSFLISVGQIFIYWIALFHIHFIIFISSIVLGMLPLLASRIFIKPLQESQAQLSEKQNKFIQILQELLQGYLVIKGANTQEKFIERFGEKNNDKLKIIRKRSLTQTMAFQALWGVNIFSALALLMVASLLVSNNQISIGQLIISMNLVSISSNVYSDILRSFLHILSMKTIREKITDFVRDVQETEPDPSQTLGFPIVMQDVSHRFGDKSILEHFSYCFEKGKCYAVIGDSGSGKSTLTRILMREIHAQSGMIYFAQMSINEYRESEIYANIGYIRQQSFIFSDTLYRNVTMLSSDKLNETDDNKYKDIIQKVNLIELQKHYQNSPLDPSKLSGGEKRRVELARALYQEKKIIIFDEPTAGLDPENQQMIDELIFSFEGVTRVVITHNWKKEYLNRFDEVIVIGKRSAENVFLN